MKKETAVRRNEEVVDIIERMPTRFGKWVAIAVVVFAFLALGAGWVIKYPDVVTGQITVNSSMAPVKLVAGSSGKIRMGCFSPREQVREGDYIAVIQNPACTDDVKRILALLLRFRPNEDSLPSLMDSLPEKISLGELNLKYFSFLTAVKNICRYGKENTYEQQIKSLEDYIKWQHLLIRQTCADTLTSKEKLDMLAKWLQRKDKLYKKDMIPEKEYDDLKTGYLNARAENQQLHKAITTIRVQISEAEGKLNLLKTEQADKEQQMHLDLLSSYNDLLDNIRSWEQKYVLKAPFDGQVEYLKFLADNQFVQSGEELFSIVPPRQTIVGQMLLPAAGAGKVEPNSEVIVKLDNYPYMEYGSIDAKVSSISLVTKEEQTANSPIETYLISIEFPRGLTTNYGKELEFKYEIKGAADIIVNDRRLVQRLFDNLKYRTR